MMPSPHARLRAALALAVGLGFGSGFAAETNQAPGAVAAPAPLAAPEPAPDAAVGTSREAPASAAPLAFDSFTNLTQRNIFDPERRRDHGPRTEPDRPADEPPRPVYFTLTGTLQYADKVYAFFRGSDPAMPRIASLQDSIGGFKLLAIDTTGVTLGGENAETRLPVGQQLRREGEQPWQVALPSGGEAENGPPPSNGSSASASAPSETPPSTGNGNRDELMRRLMERRRKELNE